MPIGAAAMARPTRPPVHRGEDHCRYDGSSVSMRSVGTCGRRRLPRAFFSNSSSPPLRWCGLVLALALATAPACVCGQWLPQNGSSILVMRMDASALPAGTATTWADLVSTHLVLFV
jgi:hypothetical protein